MPIKARLRLPLLGVLGQILQCERLGDFDAINSGGHNATSVTCTLACGIKAFDIQTLVIRTAGDPQWR
jgi:hypothetical protein